jgi:flagellar basal-body rod modification protein FlgD
MAIDATSKSGTTTQTAAQAALQQTQLDSDAFLKLFLVQLQHQDPTEPMDNAKMLEQTSQLATLQSQEKQQKAMEDITTKLAQQAQYQAQFSILPAIGKEAVTSLNGIKHDGTKKDNEFEVYFPEAIKGGTINIMDAEGKEVLKKIDLNHEDYKGKSGYVKIKWDGTNDNNEMLPAAVYLVKGEYVDESDKKTAVVMGVGKIESVKYDNGTPFLKMGSMYVGLDNVEEIR